MSEPIALETVLRILREGETNNLVTWAIEYGLGRHPQASATVADVSLSLAEKDPERAAAVVQTLRGYEALSKAPDFGARARRLLPKLEGATFRALLAELVEAEKDQARGTVLEFLDRKNKDKDQDASLALVRLPDGGALLTERLARHAPLDFRPSTAIVTLLRGVGRSTASAACALDLLARLPRRGEEIAECAVQLMASCGANLYDAAVPQVEVDAERWPEQVHADCAPVIKLGDAREAAKLLGKGKGKSAVEQLFPLVPQEWLVAPPADGAPPAASGGESDHHALDVPVARSLLQALAQSPALREKLAKEHPEIVCRLIVGAVARIREENQSSPARPEDAGLPEALAALRQPGLIIRNESGWIARTASFGAEAVAELRQMLVGEQFNAAWRAAQALLKIATPEAISALVARAGDDAKGPSVARDALRGLPRPLLAPIDCQLLREALEKQDAGTLDDVLGRWDKPCPEAEALVEILLPNAERALFSDAQEAVCKFIDCNPHPGFHACLQQLWRPGELELGITAELLLALYDPQNPLRAQVQHEWADFAQEEAQMQRLRGRVVRLRLRCRKCGAAYHYAVGGIMVFGTYLETKASRDPRDCCTIEDVIKCKRCSAIDEYDWTPQAEFSLQGALMLRSMLSRMPDKEAAEETLAQYAVQLARMGSVVGNDLTFSEVIARLNERIAGDPDNPEWRQRLGNIYFQSRQHALALAAYSELLARWPRHADAWLMRGQVYSRLGRHEEALADFVRAAVTLDTQAADAPSFAAGLRRELREEAHAAGKPVPVEALAALANVKPEEEEEAPAPSPYPLPLRGGGQGEGGRRAEPPPVRRMRAQRSELDDDIDEHDDDDSRPVDTFRARDVQVRPNDRCPCGSGRKYKKCCGRIVGSSAPTPQASLPAAAPVTQASGLRRSPEGSATQESPAREVFHRLMAKLSDAARELRTTEEAHEAVRRWCGLAADADPILVGEQQEMGLFLDYDIFDFRPSGPDRRTVLERFADKQAQTLSGEERQQLEDWLHRRERGWYEVEGTRPDFTQLRNCMTGKTVEVYDRRMSETARRGRMLLCAVFPCGQRLEISGTNRAVPRERRTAFEAWLRREYGVWSQARAPGEPEPTWERFFSEQSAEIERALVQIITAPPEMVLTTGEPIAWGHSVYEVLDYKGLLAALEATLELKYVGHEEGEEVNGEGYSWVHRKDAGKLPFARETTLDEAGPRRIMLSSVPLQPDGSSPLPSEATEDHLGAVRLSAGLLEVSAQSQERHEYLRARIEERAGHLLRLKSTSQTEASEVADIMKERREREASPRTVPPDPRTRAVLRAHLEKHFARWQEMPLPILDGKTPRQAAQDPAGRQKLEQLLRDMEEMESGGSHTIDADHIANLRVALGMPA